MSDHSIVFWIREEETGDVAGPFSITQMSEHLKKLPKDRLTAYTVKSSKWDDWRPLLSIIKDKSAGAGASPPPLPKPAPRKAAPPKKAKSALWQNDPDSASQALGSVDLDLAGGNTDSDDEEDDVFSDALLSAESANFESSISSLEKAKMTNSRQYTRYKVDVEVTFIGTNGEIFVTLTKDISLGGMQFEKPVPLNYFEDSALVSLFYRPARQRFSANLLPVAGENGFAARAYFNYLPPKNLELLHDWLKLGEAVPVPDGRIEALKKKKP